MLAKEKELIEVTVLGCGTSTGVPMVSRGFGSCDEKEPKNHRLRSSILINIGDKDILVDTSPDCRYQLLKAKVTKLDKVIFTHAHADHINGIDDLRAIVRSMNRQIDCLTDRQTYKAIRKSFSYLFPRRFSKNLYYPPVLDWNKIQSSQDLYGIKLESFYQDHNTCKTLGLKFSNLLAYSTDVVELDKTALDQLKGVQVWIVDVLGLKPHPTHAHLDKALQWIDHVKPKYAFFTHMGLSMDYRSLLAKLPNNIQPAFDGMKIKISNKSIKFSNW